MDFPAILDSSGVATGSQRIHQIGQTNERAAISIPELKFEVGGFSAVLKPARLFSKPVGNDFQHGLLGMDVLSQANEVVLDFRAMTVVLR